MKNGSVHLEIGSAFYPNDADTSKMLLTNAEGRNEMHSGGPEESLLELNEHNRREVEKAAMRGRPPSRRARASDSWPMSTCPNEKES
jgi:hypothetical protein